MSHTSASLAQVPRARARAVPGPAVRSCVLPDGVGGRGDEGGVGRPKGRCRGGAHAPLQCVDGELEGEAARDGVHEACTRRYNVLESDSSLLASITSSRPTTPSSAFDLYQTRIPKPKTAIDL